MKIAILGWGSLIWDKRSLPITGDWQRGGPVLPIEFSRVSSDGRLTLVIYPQNGAAVTTRYARSTSADLNEAITSLRVREGTTKDRIGFFNLVSNTEREWSRQQHPGACDAIEAWAQVNGWEAVIWTALISNFEQERKIPFSVHAAVAYLGGLSGPAKAKALEYIEKAPEEVVTPLRREIAAQRVNV